MSLWCTYHSSFYNYDASSIALNWQTFLYNLFCMSFLTLIKFFFFFFCTLWLYEWLLYRVMKMLQICQPNWNVLVHLLIPPLLLYFLLKKKIYIWVIIKWIENVELKLVKHDKFRAQTWLFFFPIIYYAIYILIQNWIFELNIVGKKIKSLAFKMIMWIPLSLEIYSNQQHSCIKT